MSIFNFTNVFVGVVLGLILAIYTTNVEGAPDVAQCKIAYANFFNSLEGIIQGGARAVTTTRNTYNTCAQNANSYTDLITCAVAAYADYEPKLQYVQYTKAQNIIDAFDSFAQALQPLTDNAGLPAAQRGIPIPRFRALVDESLNWRNRAPERRVGG